MLGARDRSVARNRRIAGRRAGSEQINRPTSRLFQNPPGTQMVGRVLMRLLLTSAGISNTSIHDALLDLQGKPIAEGEHPFRLHSDLRHVRSRPLDLLSPEIVARVRQALHAGILCWRQAFESAAAERSIPRGYLLSSLTKRRSPCIASDYDERFWVRHGPSGPARIRRRSRIRFEASIIRFHFLEARGHSAL
jgi:hypothetical protein